MVGKTRKDTAGCADNQEEPLIAFFRRTTAGVWSAHLVGTAGDCNTRPQLVISEQLNAAWVFLTSPNGGGAVYTKSAPLSGPGALVFRGSADETIQRGTPFIRSATETCHRRPDHKQAAGHGRQRDRRPREQPAEHDSGQQKVYLHNEMSIAGNGHDPPPAGPVAIRGGSAHSGTADVHRQRGRDRRGQRREPRPAVQLVGDHRRRAHHGHEFQLHAIRPWVLAGGGDGARPCTSSGATPRATGPAVESDTITLDTTAPTGTVAINGGAAATTSRNVTLNLSASDGAGASGVGAVLISNSTDFSGTSRWLTRQVFHGHCRQAMGPRPCT